MNEYKEYVVSLKNYKDLQSFYNEMELIYSGNANIPNRQVEIANRRPISRNTHYFLTDEEAEKLRLDARVLAVELTMKELGVIFKPNYIQSSKNWSVGEDYMGVFGLPDSGDANLNWGLLRSVNGPQKWFADAGENGSYYNVSGTINVPHDGRNVDVIICDGIIKTGHPEFLNPVTQNSRVIPYNWFQHNPQVANTASGNYLYNQTIANDDTDHGTHIAGTVAGNTQGFARSANIYNIDPYTDDPNNLLFDYIRVFHRSKTVSGYIKNPTIVNCSWNTSLAVPVSNIKSVRIKGVTTNSPFPSGFLSRAGVGGGWAEYPDDTPYEVEIPITDTALNVDIEDAAAEGIIIVGSAGNEGMLIDVTGGADFNNTVTLKNNVSYFFNRGSKPINANTTKLNLANRGVSIGTPVCITVGALGTPYQSWLTANTLNLDIKAGFSNNGPGVHIFAPGENIISAVTSTKSWHWNCKSNPAFKMGRMDGTSMASPHVCGMLACALQVYPWMNTHQALAYINQRMSQNGLVNGSEWNDTDRWHVLSGAANKIALHYNERQVSGNTFPKLNYFLRPGSGQVYPRFVKRMESRAGVSMPPF
jgi:hypothetical protein